MGQNSRKRIATMRLLCIALVSCAVLAWVAPAYASDSFASSQTAQKTELTIDTYKGTFATVNSFIVSNQNTMVVVDVQRSSQEARRLVDLIKSKANSCPSKELTHIVITHGHTDHFMGLYVLHKAFPQAKIVVATQDVKQDIIDYATFMADGGYMNSEPQMKPKSARSSNGFDYVGLIEVLGSDRLELDGGGVLEMTEDYLPNEANHQTTIYIPEINALLAADFAFNDVHLWMGYPITPEMIGNWRDELVNLKNEYVDVAPTVYPGHGDETDISVFDRNVQYIDHFTHVLRTSSSPEEAQARMIGLYPTWKEASFFLYYSVLWQFPWPAALAAAA